MDDILECESMVEPLLPLLSVDAKEVIDDYVNKVPVDEMAQKFGMSIADISTWINLIRDFISMYNSNVKYELNKW